MTNAQADQVLRTSAAIVLLRQRRKALVELRERVNDYGNRGIKPGGSTTLVVSLAVEGLDPVCLAERDQVFECFRAAYTVLTQQIKRLDDELAGMAVPS